MMFGLKYYCISMCIDSHGFCILHGQVESSIGLVINITCAHKLWRMTPLIQAWGYKCIIFN